MHQSIKLTMKVCYRLSAAKEELAEPAGGDIYLLTDIFCLKTQSPPQVSLFRLTKGPHNPSFRKTYIVRKTPALPSKDDADSVSHTCGQKAQHCAG